MNLSDMTLVETVE